MKTRQTGAIVIRGHLQGLGRIRPLATKRVPEVLVDHENGAGRFTRGIVRFAYNKIESYRLAHALQDRGTAYSIF